MLEVLVRKTETIKKELGSLSRVIDDDVERRLRGGIRHRDADDLRSEIEAMDLEDDRKCARPARSSRPPASGSVICSSRSTAARLSSTAHGTGRGSTRRRSARRSRAHWSCWARRRSRRAPMRTAVRSGPPPRSISGPRPTRAGPRPWTRYAYPARPIRSSWTGAVLRRSGR